MPSARLCRQAVNHGKPCLWVTDEILNDALDRFARVSLAHRHDSLRQRRHGSNIPGPLESHRRSAKRRLGYAAVIQDSPSNYDISAFWGLKMPDATHHLPLEKRWQWQPPDPPSQFEPDIYRQPHNLKGAAQRDGWAQFIDATSNMESEQSPDMQILERMTFERALSEMPLNEGPVDVQILEPLTQLLEASCEEFKARHVVNLIRWVSTREPTENTFAYLTDIVASYIASGLLNKYRVSEIVCSFLSMSDNQPLRLALSKILNSLDADTLETVTLRVMKAHLPRAKIADNSTKAEAEQFACLLLRYLQGCQILQGWHHSNRTWQRIYDALAIRFTDPACLADHLCGLQNSDLARILLRHWIPHVVTRARAGEERDSEMTDIRNAIKMERDVQPRHRPCAKDLVSCLETTLRLRSQSPPSSKPRSALVCMLNLLHHRGVPRQNMMKSIFRILRKRNHCATEMALFNEICQYKSRKNRERTLGIPHSLALEMINHFLATGNIRYARRVFHAVPSMPISSCPQLPLMLMQEGKVESTNIFEILWRQPNKDIMPSTKRSIPELSLVSEHIDLVHQVAEAFANSPHINSRVAFRRVYECYRFLRDRRAPLAPLLSRALVRSGIIRPFQDMRRVSTLKCKWILSIVSAIEGRDVAATLDRVVYKLWSEKILPELRLQQFYDGVRSGWKADPNANPLSRALKYKIRIWARNKRVYAVQRPAATPRVTTADKVALTRARRARRRVPSLTMPQDVSSTPGPTREA